MARAMLQSYRLGFRGPTGIHVDGSSLKTTKQAGILGHCQRALPVATNTNRRLPASFRNAREIEGLLGISRKTRVHNDHERKPMNAFAATKNLTVGMHSHHADHLTPHTLNGSRTTDCQRLVERLTCETSEASHCVAAAQRFVKLAVIPEASNDYVTESTYLPNLSHG